MTSIPAPPARPRPDVVDEALEALPDGIVLADADGVVTHANAVAARLLGRCGLPGRPLAEVMVLQDLEGRDWCTVAAPYTGLAIRTSIVEQAWWSEDGTEVLVTAKLHRERPGGPVLRVGVSLRSAHARSRLDRERSDLVATVAHELRSPLTGVKGFTGTLLSRWDKFSDEQKKLIMQSVHTDTDRLTRLISELLEVARIDTGRLTLRPQPMDPVAAVRRIASSVRAGTGREIRLDLAEDLPQLLADSDRFTQVVTNLVENAVQHGEGAVTVRVDVVDAAAPEHPQGGASSDAGDQAWVRIAVSDQGEGIRPEIRSRVFTKFWKHGTKGGSGLGLYIAHGLVTAHGGRISIEETADGGACVETRWPPYDPES